LRESAGSHGLEVHAYVLMGNHVHLLVSSGEPGKVSLAMRQLGQGYVTGFNRRAIDAPEHFGKVASSPAWLTRTATCSPPIGISN
jgi:REP element-mobilizing transposase RayT